MVSFQLGKLPWRLTVRNVTFCHARCMIASQRHINPNNPNGSVVLYDLLGR